MSPRPVELHPGDSRESLRRLIDQGVRVHAVVTDPPYSLTSITKRFGKEGAAPARREGNDGSFARVSGGFMGKAWDATGIERDPEFWRLVWEILLPGGCVFAFSGARTGHWQGVAMEMAGFIMHPTHGWIYGQGFPKAHDAARAIDKMLGVEGTFGDPKSAAHAGWIERGRMRAAPEDATNHEGWQRPWMADEEAVGNAARQYLPGSPEAQEWFGWKYGTQTQKPAMEPLYLGQKPYSEKTGAANLLKHGVGAFNVDATRVPTSQGFADNNQHSSTSCTCCEREAFQNAHIQGNDNGDGSRTSPDHPAFPISNVPSYVPEMTELLGSQADYQTCPRSDDGLVLSNEVGDRASSQPQRDADRSLDRCAKCGRSREDLSKPLENNTTRHVKTPLTGRYPANLLHDGSPEVLALFPGSKGQQGAIRGTEPSRPATNVYDTYSGRPAAEPRGDDGSSGRFFNSFPLDDELIGDIPTAFYHSKAGKADRAGTKHPTVKPVGLLRHLIRHICPPGGLVLDPFAGSGTTAVAAQLEGMRCVLMEAEPEYVSFLRRRFALETPTQATVQPYDDYADLLGDHEPVKRFPTNEDLSALLG